jgi:hypothetical protein
MIASRLRCFRPRSTREQLQQDLPYQLGNARKDRGDGLKLPFLQALQRMRIYDSTDPRDKVYAALALSPQVIDDFRPDHSKSLRQVYIDEVL